MMRDAQKLVDTLREPETVLSLDGHGWTQLVSIARAESLIGSLAHRLKDIKVPEKVKPVLKDAIEAHDLARQQALWEADCARRALANLGVKTVLMKGTAYVAADLRAGIGRSIGDLDIMVAKADLPAVEENLLDAGWEWVKPDPYDDQYYRDHMHELPPLIHRERDRMIDVHHTILPLTARPKPDALAMLDDAVQLESGLYVFSPVDRIIHSVAHLFADGDLAGGLRNLWDIFNLKADIFNAVMDGSEPPDPNWVAMQVHEPLAKRAASFGLEKAVARAFRLAEYCYGPTNPELSLADKLFLRRLLARDGYGRETRKFTRLAFYIRSHWLRMPPLMLAKHLWTKWHKGKAS